MWKQESFLVQFRFRRRPVATQLIQCSRRSTFGNESVIQKRCGTDASNVFRQESTPSRVPISTACPENPAQSDQLDRQHIELFVQQAPDERTGAYDTLEAAIEAHEAEFGPAS
jgi:hypothetical protein